MISGLYLAYAAIIFGVTLAEVTLQSNEENDPDSARMLTSFTPELGSAVNGLTPNYGYYPQNPRPYAEPSGFPVSLCPSGSMVLPYPDQYPTPQRYSAPYSGAANQMIAVSVHKKQATSIGSDGLSPQYPYGKSSVYSYAPGSVYPSAPAYPRAPGYLSAPASAPLYASAPVYGSVFATALYPPARGLSEVSEIGIKSGLKEDS